MLFRIGVYFTEYLLAVEIDEKRLTDRNLIFEEKRQEELGKKFGRQFIRIDANKEGYDADYEASRIQTFISKFKDRKLKKIKQENKKTRRQNRKIDLSNHSMK